jgi:hypothetical protein
MLYSSFDTRINNVFPLLEFTLFVAMFPKIRDKKDAVSVFNRGLAGVEVV